MDDWEGPIDTGSIPEDGGSFDVIVVGGGPSGSAAASYNALNGCKVLLIEKDICLGTRSAEMPSAANRSRT